jgi:hypothetical protein
MAYRSQKYQTLYGRYLLVKDRSIIHKTIQIKRLLSIAEVSWIYVHQKKLINGNIKTIAIDLLATMTEDEGATYGVFTNEMVFQLFNQAKKEYIRRAFQMFTFDFYKKLIGV